MKKFTYVIALTFAIGFGIDFFSGSTIYNWLLWQGFGLSGNSSAYDYLTSSIAKRVKFSQLMCDDGVCLDPIDWKCGFTVNSPKFQSEQFLDWDEAVNQCFDKMVRVVPVYTELDKVRKICGRRYMQFDPDMSSVSKLDCEAQHGIWGAKIVHWSDEADLLKRLGLQ